MKFFSGTSQQRKPTWRKCLITYNSHLWIMFSFNWLVIIWREGRGVSLKLDVQGQRGGRILDVDGQSGWGLSKLDNFHGGHMCIIPKVAAVLDSNTSSLKLQLCWTPTQVLSCEYCEFLINRFLYKTLPVAKLSNSSNQMSCYQVTNSATLPLTENIKIFLRHWLFD